MNNNNLQNIKLSLNQLNINQIDKLNNLKYQERYEKIAEIIRSNKSDIIIFQKMNTLLSLIRIILQILKDI